MDLFSILNCIHSTFLALESLQQTTEDTHAHALKSIDPTSLEDSLRKTQLHLTKPLLSLDVNRNVHPSASIDAAIPKQLKKRVNFKESTFYLIPTREEIFSTTLKSDLYYNPCDIALFKTAAVAEVKLFMANNAIPDFRIASMQYYGVRTDVDACAL